MILKDFNFVRIPVPNNTSPNIIAQWNVRSPEKTQLNLQKKLLNFLNNQLHGKMSI